MSEYSSHRKEAQSLSENTFVDTNTMFDGLRPSEIAFRRQTLYHNYADAMGKRGREPLEQEKFDAHFFAGRSHEKTVAFGSEKDGHILGCELGDVFVPTHFAPSGLKQGYRIIKDLVDSENPTAFFVTPDLVDTLSKMPGWKVLPFRFNTRFRDKEVEKIMVVNKWKAVKGLISYHVFEHLRNRLSGTKRRLEMFGDKALSLIRKPEVNTDQMEPQIAATIPPSLSIQSWSKENLFNDEEIEE